MFSEGKRGIKYLYVPHRRNQHAGCNKLDSSENIQIAEIYDYEILSEYSASKPQAAHATGSTLTDTSMRCPPEPRITPSTGATSV